MIASDGRLIRQFGSSHLSQGQAIVFDQLVWIKLKFEMGRAEVTTNKSTTVNLEDVIESRQYNVKKRSHLNLAI